MHKKKMFIVLALVTALAVPASVFAATSDTSASKAIRGFFGLDKSKLTDKQKGDVTEYSKKMADLQKEFINKMVANGSMTKEQGEAAIKKIDEMAKNGEVPGLTNGHGMRKGGFDGRKMGAEFVLKGIDISKLTDKQKADLTEFSNKMAVLHKENVNKLVAEGIITKEQGDNAIKRINEMLANSGKTGFICSIGMGKGGFGFFGLHGVDLSKLTDKQKTTLTELTKKVTDLQKEFINKMVANGTMTKEQGDAALKKLDQMGKLQNVKGSFKGMKKVKGHFGGFEGKGKVNKITPTPTPAPVQ
ncbi:MAG: YckD family protein [Clostridia bacterium]|nr:YckD family protein [Clostridia bacterium]